MHKPGDSVWVVTGGRKRAATVHSYLHDYDLYCLINVEGLPANPNRKGWRAPGWRVFARDDKPYAGKVLRIDNLRLSFLTPPKEQPTMIDKSKPFYIVRTPEFGTGAHYTPARGSFPAREIPELWRAKQDKDEAIKSAMDAAGGRGVQFDVFELRLVGSTAPPVATWVPVKKPRVRRVKRNKRKGRK